MDFKDLYDGKNISNMSFVDEVQKNQQNLRDMARAEAIKQDPTLNYVQRQLAQGLLGAKMDWQRAYDAGDANGMATAALNAQDLRNRAESIGWNGNGYGSDVSLLEAAQNLANNDTRAVNDILYNLKDSNDIYQQKVVDYLDKGYSIDSAKRMAGQRSNEATANNVNQLRDAFRMYGMDERGAITPQGADILGSLALQGQSELANFYSNMMPKPVQNWQFGNDLLKMAQAQTDRLASMDRQQQYNRENQERSQNFQKEMAMLNNDLSIQRMVAGVELDIKKGIATKEAGYNFIVKVAMDAGYSEDVARKFAAQSIIGGGKGNSMTGFNKDLAKELRETAQSLEEQAKDAELNGNKEEAARLRAEAAAMWQQHRAALGMNTGGGNVDTSTFSDYNEAMHWATEIRNANNKAREAGQAYASDDDMRRTLALRIPPEWLDDAMEGWGSSSTPATNEAPKKENKSAPTPINHNAPGSTVRNGALSSGSNMGADFVEGVSDWLKSALSNSGKIPVYDAYNRQIGTVTAEEAADAGYNPMTNNYGQVYGYRKN